MSESLTFEDWISRVFDHPEDPANMHRSADFWIDDKTRAAALLEETFSRAAEFSPRFSDRQLEAGLWLLLGEGYAAEAMRGTVPLERRTALVRSTRLLFETLFAARCPDLDFGGNDPLYRVCYMFWELFPNGSKAPEKELSLLREERFASLEAILGIDKAMCQYSALHGLGHLRFKDAARVERIIDRYLAEHPEPGFVLREYALDARRGDVQ